MAKELNENKQLNAIYVDINKLKPFRKSLFGLYDGERYEDFKADIEKRGIRTPITIRSIKEDDPNKSEYPNAEYEIIAGHNRVKVTRDLNMATVPAIIREYESDEEAEIDVVMSNMQRSITDMPHSAKAKMLKQYHAKIFSEKKLRELEPKPKGRKNKKDENGVQSEPEKRMNEKIGDKYDLDINKVKRYLRIAELNDNLLEKIDTGVIPFIAGVHLSHLKKGEQDFVNTAIDGNECKITVDNAQRLKTESKNSQEQLPLDKIIMILSETIETTDTNNSNITLNLKSAIKDEYFTEDSHKSIEKEIVKSIELTKNKIPALLSDYAKFDNPTKEEMKKLIASIKKLFESKK